MGDESYGPRFVVVGSRSESKPPVAQKPNLPRRTPSRADNARRWAPAAYAKNHAEVNRNRVHKPLPPPPITNSSSLQSTPQIDEFQEKALPPPPPEPDYDQPDTKPFYI